jgi:DNA-binding Xre family transcriptional regulator
MDDKQKKVASLNTGAMLNKYITDNRIRKNALARALNRNINSLNSYLNKSSIQTSILFELCHALEHNFFAEFAKALPENYSTNVPEDTTNAAKIAELTAENQILKAEKAVLLQALQRKV